jgi:hypothetical protein
LVFQEAVKRSFLILGYKSESNPDCKKLEICIKKKYKWKGVEMKIIIGKCLLKKIDLFFLKSLAGMKMFPLFWPSLYKKM